MGHYHPKETKQIHFYLHDNRGSRFAAYKFKFQRRITKTNTGKKVSSIRIDFLKFSLFIEVGFLNV